MQRKQIEEQIAEQIRHLDDSMSIYQTLIDDLRQSEFITKSAEGSIANARSVIAKAQTLIWDYKQKFANEKKRAEELEAARDRVQQELNARSSQLEALHTWLATKKVLSDEELRVQALAEIEEAHQRDIQHLKNQIKSLTEWE